MMVIGIACFRTDYQTKTPAQLAIDIAQPVALRSLALTSAFKAAVANGASLAELGAVYRVMNNEYIANLRDALHAGDLAQTQILVAIASSDTVLNFSQATKDALQAVITANELRLVDVVATELDQPAPETVTAADVEAAMSEAGYQWNGSWWEYAGS